MDYSVIIRTVGRAGEKYRRLLESIEKLHPAPRETIVMLPHGYIPPDAHIVGERICYCPKGMVAQRVHGIAECQSEYILLLDDDIAFEADFVQKLYTPIAQGAYDITAGPLTELFPNKTAAIIRSFLGASAVPARKTANYYARLMRSTGYQYNRIATPQPQVFPTETAGGACIFARTDVIRNIHYEDELWLDRNTYALHDDTVLFYKAHCNGLRCGIVADAVYAHLDAGTSKTGGNAQMERGAAFNRIVLWHRFIYKQERSVLGKAWATVCLMHRFVVQFIVFFCKALVGLDTWEIPAAHFDGIIQALKWRKSEEYQRLPAGIKEKQR